MKKSELELMSVDSLRKKASELKIKNYIKTPKVELIEKIYGLLYSPGDELETTESEELTQEELFLKKFSDLKNSISLENGSEVAFTDYVGEKHIGTIISKDGVKYKIRAFDDNILYTMAPIKIEGAEELLKSITPEEEFIVTDKMNKSLKVGQRCRVRREGVWSEGTIIEFKEIKDEDYIHVQIDGVTISKLINTADVIGLSEDSVSKPLSTTPKSAVKTTTKKMTNKPTPFTPEQQEYVDKLVGQLVSKEVTKKDFTLSLMEYGITKQQIDKYVDSSIISWSYVYPIYKQYGK